MNRMPRIGNPQIPFSVSLIKVSIEELNASLVRSDENERRQLKIDQHQGMRSAGYDMEARIYKVVDISAGQSL